MTDRREYRVDMVDRRGRRSFTLVNAEDPEQARKIAEGHHAKPGGAAERRTDAVTETGRAF